MNYPYNPYAQSGINWVPGEEGAKAFPMVPGTNVILMDNMIEHRMYIKICDQVGMCTLRYFNCEEFDPQQVTQQTDYVTRSELEKILEELKNDQSVPTAKRGKSTE